MRIPTGVSAGLSLTLVSCGYLLVVAPGGVAGSASTAAAPGANPGAGQVVSSPAAPPGRSASSFPVIAATGPAVRPASMPAPPDLIVGADQNGDTVSLALGQSLVVSLDGNATTGYAWELGRVKRKILSTDGDVAYTPTALATPQPGSGGVFTARFTAVGLGQSYVKLVYDRPFEADTPPVKTFTLLVLVTSWSNAGPAEAPSPAPTALMATPMAMATAMTSSMQ